MSEQTTNLQQAERELSGRTDTERIDWLQWQKYGCFGINYHDGRWVAQIECNGDAWRAETLRAAIDDAMAKEQR